jgi:hypothetical protein
MAKKCKTPGKAGFATRGLATAAIVKHKTDMPLMAYKCPQCHLWHISSHAQRPARRK